MLGKEKMPKSIYTQLIDDYTQQVSRQQSKSRMIGWTRLFIFVLLLFFSYKFLSPATHPVFLVLVIVLCILFLMLIKVHQNVKFKRDLSSKHLEINLNEQSVQGGNPSIFRDGNSLVGEHRFAADLDLFGNGSLFHFINRCGTYTGLIHLSNVLKDPFIQPSEILERQASVQELSLKTKLRQNVLAHGMLLELLQDSESLNSNFKIAKPNNYFAWWWSGLLIIWPIIMVGLTIYFFRTLDVYPLLTGILFALTVVGLQAKKTQYHSTLISGKSTMWKLYATLFDIITSETYETKLLQKIKHNLNEATHGTASLAKLGNAFDQRLNMLAFVILNSYLLYDIHMNRRWIKWVNSFGSKLSKWIDELGLFESLSSIATFQFNHPEFAIPKLTEEITIQGVDVGHPLITDQKRVHNDFAFGPKKNLFIITGSNMAGKSTFLRTLGVNCILAQIGSPVCAKNFSLKPMPIHSSIRMSDSLQEETSYFFAELKKLQQILSDLDKGIPSLVLLDEVLKGTNSEDKIYGANELIKKLVKKDALIFLATHILSLGDLEKQYPEAVENYCFESTINEDELHFDYKLKTGVAQQKNATFLMKKMGII